MTVEMPLLLMSWRSLRRPAPLVPQTGLRHTFPESHHSRAASHPTMPSPRRYWDWGPWLQTSYSRSTLSGCRPSITWVLIRYLVPGWADFVTPSCEYLLVYDCGYSMRMMLMKLAQVTTSRLIDMSGYPTSANSWICAWPPKLSATRKSFASM